MIGVALTVFALRRPSPQALAYPRWQAVLAVTGLSLLAAISMARADPVMLLWLPAWAWYAGYVGLSWAVFLTYLGLLELWLRRGGRWNGEGGLFRLLVATSVVVELLRNLLLWLGLSPWFILLLQGYSMAVVIQALRHTIPTLTAWYAGVGVLLSIVVTFLLYILAFFLLTVLFRALWF